MKWPTWLQTHSQVLLHLTVLVIVSLWLCLELFMHPTQPQTFDGWTHLSTLYHYVRIWNAGGWPVSWVDGVANYGLPLGLLAHQLTSYVGAGLVLLTGNLLTGYAALAWLGAGLGAMSLYWFLRQHFSPQNALVAALLFNFAPYRIINLYIRGAMPEFWASIFIPVMLLGINWWWLHRRPAGLIVGTLGLAGLALTHPMMLLPGGVIVLAYVVLLMCLNLKNWKRWWLGFLGLAVMGVLGFGIAGYYLVPLFAETKYFYYGNMVKGGPDSSFNFLSVSNFITEQWRYTEIPGNGVRAPILQLGVIEMGVWIVAFAYGVAQLLRRQWQTTQQRTLLTWLLIWSLAGLVMAIFSLPLTLSLYQNFSIIASLQHPWRWLTALSLMAPILLAQLLELLTPHLATVKAKSTWRWWVAVLLITLPMAWWRFPELYSKNRVAFDKDRFNFVIVNPHSTNMNPVWTSASWEYPVQPEKLAIIEGDGRLENVQINPASRRFNVIANSPIRIADYSFYFPGWEVTAANQPVALEYQDPDYRGVITYRLPAGQYQVTEKFGLTKLRLLGWLVSAGSLLALLGWAVITTPPIVKRYLQSN